MNIQWSNRKYFGMGIESIKYENNMGTLMRSAHCFNADFIYTIGAKYRETPGDTTKVSRGYTILHWTNPMEMRANTPPEAMIVGVETPNRVEEVRANGIIAPTPVEIIDFIHPDKAVYVLGNEARGLSDDMLAVCNHIVYITTNYCLNVSVAGSIIIYDRYIKERANE